MKKDLAVMALAVALFVPALAMAQDPVVAVEAADAGGKVCVDNLNDLNSIIVIAIGGVIAVSSALANVVKKDSFLGKLIHFLALNITVAKDK